MSKSFWTLEILFEQDIEKWIFVWRHTNTCVTSYQNKNPPMTSHICSSHEKTEVTICQLKFWREGRRCCDLMTACYVIVVFVNVVAASLKTNVRFVAFILLLHVLPIVTWTKTFCSLFICSLLCRDVVALQRKDDQLMKHYCLTL